VLVLHHVTMLAVELHKTESLLVSLWSSWGAFASFVVAGVAFFVSVSQARTAKKALRLSLLQDERSNARLQVSLKDAIDWIPDATCRWIAVRLLVLNPSDSQGALTEADLSISYRSLNGKLLVLKIGSDSVGVYLPKGVTGLMLPTSLASNGAVEGWFIFQIHNSLLREASVESYTVTLYDSRGVSASVQPIIFRRC
jgi:hypothetical protein